MSQQNETARKIRLWEQHGQTIMLFVITGALAWTANTLWESNTSQAALTAEVRHLSSQMAELRGGLNAMQTQYVTRPEFVVHEQRLQTLEANRNRP